MTANSEVTEDLSGGSADYYKVPCKDDEGNEYIVECRHIISAKNMNFNWGNIFKTCFREDKPGNPTAYDLEKNIFFSLEELRRLGVINNNKEAVKLFEKILGADIKDYLEG